MKQLSVIHEEDFKNAVKATEFCDHFQDSVSDINVDKLREIIASAPQWLQPHLYIHLGELKHPLQVIQL